MDGGRTEAQTEIFREAIQKVHDIIDAGEPWTDPDFPPCDDSLRVPGSSSEPLCSHSYEWKRASEMYPDVKVFDSSISPSDINQGALGNCYFLAVLSAMAENEENVRKRFIFTEPNAAGVYLVNLFINGYETPVIVDDWFPSKWGRPAFCKTHNGEIWPMLLEKAWAKVHGSYMRTEGGQTAHATQHLLGIPAFTLNHDD